MKFKYSFFISLKLNNAFRFGIILFRDYKIMNDENAIF